MFHRIDACRTGTGRRARRPLNALNSAVIAAALLATTIAGAPAAAQQPPDGETSSTSTTADPSETTETTETTATTAAGETTSTTAAPETTPETPDQTSTTTPTETSETTDTTGPESTDTTDPLIDEAPADEPLDPNVTVPAPSGADAGVDLAPVPILWSNVRDAEAKWAEAQAAKVEAIVQVRALRLRSKELDARQRELEDETQLTIDELVAATERLQARAVRGFVETSSGNATGEALGTELFRSRELLVSRRKSRLIGAAVDVDQAGMAELAELKASLGTSAFELMRRSGVIDTSMRRAVTAAEELDVAIDQARIEMEAFRAGSDIYISGVQFPIAGTYSVPLINSFGFPRMPGTPDAHWHEGIDIFAPRGTPLVAAERGVIGRVGNGRLGGLKFWLRGESGADWYYAHLDGFAPGLHNGQVVEAGELLGYVGNTGNAVGTPPHLHLEIHPGGGEAVNPYPLLKVVSDLDLKSFVDGTHPGHRYQPVVVDRPEETTTTSTEPPPAAEPPPTEPPATTHAPSPETSPSSAPTTSVPPTPSSETTASTIAPTTAGTDATGSSGGG